MCLFRNVSTTLVVSDTFHIDIGVKTSTDVDTDSRHLTLRVVPFKSLRRPVKTISVTQTPPHITPKVVIDMAKLGNFVDFFYTINNLDPIS